MELKAKKNDKSIGLKTDITKVSKLGAKPSKTSKKSARSSKNRPSASAKEKRKTTPKTKSKKTIVKKQAPKEETTEPTDTEQEISKEDPEDAVEEQILEDEEEDDNQVLEEDGVNTKKKDKVDMKNTNANRREPKASLDADSALQALKDVSRLWFDFSHSEEDKHEMNFDVRPTKAYMKTERFSKLTRNNAKKVMVRGGFIPLRRLHKLVKECFPETQAQQLKIRKGFLKNMRTHLENAIVRKYVAANLIRCGKGKTVLTESDFFESSILKLF